jgi:hypothetical protein
MPLRAKGDMAYRAGSMTQLISPPRASEPDPIRAVLAIVAVFAVLVFWRLGTPSKIMFDEVHYLPAARHLIDLSSRLNPEHPLLGKELIALGMMVFGDNPFGWRFCNALYGVIGLYGAIRAFWWASLSRQGRCCSACSGDQFHLVRAQPHCHSGHGHGRLAGAGVLAMGAGGAQGAAGAPRSGGCSWGCRWAASGTACR